MKLVVFTSSFHIGARITLNRILQSKEFRVVGIVHHQVMMPNIRSVRKIGKMMDRAGFFFIFMTAFVNILQKVGIFYSRITRPWKKRRLFNVDELAHKYQIPILITENVNLRECLHFVKEKEPDILVSCYLLQILGKKMLSIPKKGAINVHPALLPKFPGSWTNFWVLFYGEKRAGATVHYMNEELDSGDIVLQKSFRIKKWQSLQCFTRKMAHFSADVLMKALQKMKQKKESPQKMKRSKHLFGLPTKKEIEKSHRMFPFVRLCRLIEWF